MQPLQTIGKHIFTIESVFLPDEKIENFTRLFITAVTDKEEYIKFDYTKFKKLNRNEARYLLILLKTMNLSYREFKQSFVQSEILTAKINKIKGWTCSKLVGSKFVGITSYEVYLDLNDTPRVKQRLLTDMVMHVNINTATQIPKTVINQIARTNSYVSFRDRGNTKCTNFLNQLLGIRSLDESTKDIYDPF